MIKEVFKKVKLKYVFLISIEIILIVFMTCSNALDALIVNEFEKHNLLIKDNELYLHFLSVGASDCAIIEFPTGEVAIVDTGTQFQSKIIVNYIKNKIINNRKDKTIDYLFLSHADEDHIGGAWQILNNFEVGFVIRPQQYASFEYVGNDDVFHANSSVYDAVVEKINNSAKKVIFAQDNMEFRVGEVKLKIFYMLHSAVESNDFSYYLKVSFRNKSVLFTGDATNTSEIELMSTHPNEICADILKVAHHGAKTSSSLEFLEAVRPKYAIISVGKNSNGHPSSVTLENLKEAGIKEVLRTDEKGNILFKIDDEIKLYLNDFSFIHFVSSDKISIVLIVFVLSIVITDLRKNTRNKKKS